MQKETLDIVVYVATRRNTPVSAWSTVTATPPTLSDTEVRTGTTPNGINEAILEALQDVLHHRDGEKINIFTASPMVFKAAEYIAKRVTDVHVYQYNQRRDPHPLHADALTEANTALQPLLPKAAPAPPPRTRIATDGSWSRFNKLAGIGVLAEDGRWHAQAFPHYPNPLAAELKAIEAALDMTQSSKEPLLIVCDSQPAIDALNGANTVGSNKVTFLSRIRRKLRKRDVELNWTKGHAGDALNEGADRLAVSARRNHEGAVDPATARAIEENIVSEALNQHNREPIHS